MQKNKLYFSISPLITICIILFIWEIVSYFNIVNPLFLPKLDNLIKAFIKEITINETYINTLDTILRALWGLLISIIFAVPLGLVFGRFPKIYSFFEFPSDFFRSIPSSSLFPLFMLIFGIGNYSKVGIVFYGCSLILLVNTIYGSKPTKEKQDRINMLRSFGASQYQIFKYAILRDALPQIAAGIRICISLSFVLVIVTEMFLGASTGLGRLIYDNYLQYNIPEMYSVIIILGLVGYFANKSFFYFEKKLIFWLPNNQ